MVLGSNINTSYMIITIILGESINLLISGAIYIVFQSALGIDKIFVKYIFLSIWTKVVGNIFTFAALTYFYP